MVITPSLSQSLDDVAQSPSTSNRSDLSFQGRIEMLLQKNNYNKFITIPGVTTLRL